MAAIIIAALTLTASTVSAFKDTSPFFLFSTSRLQSLHLDNIRLASSSILKSNLIDSLSACPTESYIVVSQPGVSAQDFARRSAAPHLRQWLNGTDSSIQSTIIVPEVHGLVQALELTQFLEDKCRASIVTVDAATGAIPNEDANPRIIKVDFSLLPEGSSERSSKLSEHDSFLNAVISTIGGQKYTVLYTTTPPSKYLSNVTPEYQMDDPYVAIPHSELKRDLSIHAGNSTSNLPLFQKYEFISPAIFMGLFVSLILSSILYVGLSALRSLQVSYFAFSKEMGPSAQKKQ